jgi:hypothetical protein
MDVYSFPFTIYSMKYVSEVSGIFIVLYRKELSHTVNQSCCLLHEYGDKKVISLPHH